MTWRHILLAARLLALTGCVGTEVSDPDSDNAAATVTHATVVAVRSADTHVKIAFDDKMTVQIPGKPDVTFAASTHPWFQNNAAAPDVDHDGVPDVGMLKPGKYHAKKKGTTYGAPTYAVSQLNGNPAVPGWRNTNHDDVYSDAEKAASDARGDLLTDILVHAAGPGSIAPIGCQVLSRDDMNALAKLVGDEFDYELKDAE
jgi:hypothetical protein